MDVKEIIVFAKDNGREPFTEWLQELADVEAQKRIRLRLYMLKRGNAGDCKSLGDGVFELRFQFGPGYRVYFGQEGPMIVILLCGGDKRSQARDVRQAKQFWETHKAWKKRKPT